MTPAHNDESEREKRLNQVLLAYVEAVQEGRAPDRRQLLSSYPEFTADLLEFFALRDQMDRLAAPLREVVLAGALPRGIAEFRTAGARSAERGAQSAEHVAALGARRPALGTAVSELGQIGEFHLLREIGRGGMGVVYEAHQTSLNRRVALKVLPFAAALDPKQLQRFQNEAQAAAQLHHTNIVPVYAVGCERGVHYYAMQFIEGQSLAAMIEELRQQERVQTAHRADPGSAVSESGNRLPVGGETTGPYSPLPSPPEARREETATTPAAAISTGRSTRPPAFFRRVAQLGMKAAEALEHAHQLGVVHRDIKPANLLVDARGDLWITDFGLALFQSSAGLTLTGELVGTLRYMSPEQAWAKRGEVDHRTDIYSLGVSLYELLTLRPAFDGQDRQELLQQIASEEPRAPRHVDKAIPVELETIVLKAIAKSPADRYTTAQELADDLQRFLEDKPILARRPSLRERATKWVRRHRSVVVSAVALMVITMVGSVISTVLIAAAYDRERVKAQEAEENFRQARRAVDQFAQISDELAGSPFLEGTRRRLLESALVYYQEFIEQRRDDPATQAELRDTKASVEKILADLAVLQGAGQFYLLGHSAVLDDLGLKDEQREKVIELSGRMKKRGRELFPDFGKLSSEERERRFLVLTRANDEGVRQVLTPEQLRRLRQIALQLHGLRAFDDPDVAAALKLAAQQKVHLRTIEAEVFVCGPGRDHVHGPGRDHGPGLRGPRKPPDHDLRSASEKIQTVLTPEQARKWKEMTGEPFKGPAPAFFPGPPGPFGLPHPKGPPQ